MVFVGHSMERAVARPGRRLGYLICDVCGRMADDLRLLDDGYREVCEDCCEREQGHGDD